ncbi:MAG: hypothetical protein AAFY41_13145, partial [Bacteroidota bacterium]
MKNSLFIIFAISFISARGQNIENVKSDLRFGMGLSSVHSEFSSLQMIAIDGEYNLYHSLKNS